MSKHAGRVENRVVVITGAARGIGAAIARAVAAAGGKVVLLDLDAASLAAIACELRDAVLLSVAADVRCEDSLQAVAAELVAKGIGVDVLVNNAGVYAQGPILELPQEDLQWCLEVNVCGMFRCCRALVPLMSGRRRAQIVNILSEFAWIPFPNKAAYCVSKAAAAMASACMRSEFSRTGIRVTDIIPPAVDTGLVRQARAVNTSALEREIELVRSQAASANVVGRAVLGAIQRPQNVVICGMQARASLFAARLMPSITQEYAARIARRHGLV